jgi:tetratricopeptide (TPR) repeat protein
MISNLKAMKSSMFSKVVLLTGLFSVIMIYSIQSQDLKSAIQLTKSESYDKAEEMYKALIQKEPGNSKYYFYNGENYLLNYFADTISNSLTVATKAANEIYQKGVSANPNDPLNYIGLAKVANYLGDDAKANEMRAKAKSFLLPYKNIKKIVPPAQDYAFALAKIAESYANDGSVDTSLALPLIRQAVKIDSKNAEIFLITGDLYMMANDGSNAIRNYNLAQFADPQSPTAAMKIGYVYFKSGAFTPAIQNFEEAIKLNANYAPAYRELGQLYWRAGRLEQSKTNFKKYLDLTEGNIPAKTKYVNSLFYAGDYEEVIKNVEEIMAVDQSRGYMNRLAGYSYFEKDNPDYNKALSYMDKLFKTVDKDSYLQKDHHYMARILLKKNQNYPKMVDELASAKNQLDREKSKLATAAAADKPKWKTSVDELTRKISGLESSIASANKEIDRAFTEFDKAFKFKRTDPNAPMTSQERAILSEMASNYYTYRRYDSAAKTLSKLIDPAKENNLGDYMQIGRAYYLGEKYKSADSVFSAVVKKSPDYLPAYVQIARTYSKMDPETKLGLARPKFEKLLSVAAKDSVKNENEMSEALRYLGYYNMENGNYTKAKDYYNRLINLNPQNKENKINGLNGLGGLESKAAGQEKTVEGKLGFLAKSAEAYEKIIAIDANNASAKSNLNWIRDYQASVKKGINPNEIKGVITNTAGQPLAFASIKVKDTAAETLTNAKGEYKFEIPQGSEILVFSAKGYKSQEVAITKIRVYNAKLEQ